MNTKTAVKEITFFCSPASKLQALIKHKYVQDLYIPDLDEKQEEEERQTRGKQQSNSRHYSNEKDSEFKENIQMFEIHIEIFTINKTEK
jgi:hypothetical protein